MFKVSKTASTRSTKDNSETLSERGEKNCCQCTYFLSNERKLSRWDQYGTEFALFLLKCKNRLLGIIYQVGKIIGRLHITLSDLYPVTVKMKVSGIVTDPSHRLCSSFQVLHCTGTIKQTLTLTSV